MFFFNDTATTEIYTLSLHDALPIFTVPQVTELRNKVRASGGEYVVVKNTLALRAIDSKALAQLKEHFVRSEEHTSELQSRQYLVCRLLLEKTQQLLQSNSQLKFNVT